MTKLASDLSLPCAPGEIDSFLSRPHEGTLKLLETIDSDILVLGAGGKMGLHLCRMLREGCDRLGKQNRIFGASRFKTLAGRKVYEDAGIETLVGDFRDKSFLDSLPDCPVVFYLVGAKFGTAGNPALLQEINVDLPARVADRFPKARMAAFSTGCVYTYTTPMSGGSVEGSKLEPVGEYAKSCLGREEAFNSGSERHGTPVVLLRINYSVEFRYGVPVDIGRKVLAGEPVDVTMGYVNVIWQNDALNHVIQSLRLAGSPPVPINITGPEVTSVRRIAERFGQLFGKEPVFTGEEAPSAWLSNASKAHRLFGKPSVSLDQMLEWIAIWLVNNYDTYDKPTGFERRDGKF
jgi:nucleoside-diphosphate-sugar epimerase